MEKGLKNGATGENSFHVELVQRGENESLKLKPEVGDAGIRCM